MGTVSVSLPADGETIDASDYNTPITTIVNAINGNLDNANIATSAAIDGSKLANTSITATKLATAVNPETRDAARFFDHISSGCVWSGDSYGSTRAASCTSGVVFLSGKYLTVAAVTARSFTASKDTYCDLQDNGDGTAIWVYSEATNNAASSSLTAGNVRGAIIVTGASSIANVGSINQGQETKVLPIASSIPYAVTDSLGNLICPRDPNRKILGYRMITSSFVLSSSQTTPTQVTGLTCPVIIPTGRKVRVSGFCSTLTVAAGIGVLSVWDGTVNSGTQLTQFNNSTASGTGVFPTTTTTPSATSKTYNIGTSNSGANNTTVNAGATLPAFIKVELE